MVRDCHYSPICKDTSHVLVSAKNMLKCQTGIKWHTALGCWSDGYKWPLYSHGISKATLFWCLHGTLR